MDRSQATGDGRVNQLGGMYVSGKPLPSQLRSRIIELACRGLRQCDISRQLKVTHGCISKLLSKYQETGNLDPSQNAGRPRVITAEIETKIDEYRREDPGAFCWELRERLITDRVCGVDEAPSLSSISRLVKSKIINEAVEKRTNMKAEKVVSQRPSQVLTSFSIATILNMNSGMEREKTNDVQSKKQQLLKSDPEPYSRDVRIPLPLTNRTQSILDSPSRPQRRERTKFNHLQSNALEREFQKNPYPGIQRRIELACKLEIDESRIQVWFANRRAKGRRRNVSSSDSYHSKELEIGSFCSCQKNSNLSAEQKFSIFVPPFSVNNPTIHPPVPPFSVNLPPTHPSHPLA